MGEIYMDKDEAWNVYNETGWDPFEYFEQQNNAEFLILYQNDEYILIQDIGHKKQKKTITNDAEFIVRELYNHYDLEKRRLIYFDSDNRVDEILHNRGNFIDFKAGHEGIEIPKTENLIIEQITNMDDREILNFVKYVFLLLDEKQKLKIWNYIIKSFEPF